MKICVIGYGATGKSTLSRHLSERLGVPLLSLEELRYEDDGTERNLEEAISQVEAFMSDNDSWVIDGNQPRLLEKERYEFADIIIFLDFNRFNSLKWAIRREREKKREGRLRERERVTFDYILYTLHGGRTWRQKAHYSRIMSRHPEKVRHIKKPSEIEGLVEVILSAQ